MNDRAQIVETLTRLYLDLLGVPSEAVERLGAEERAHFEGLSSQAKTIITQLLEECYRSGFPSEPVLKQVGVKPMSGGMAAECVFELLSEISCVAKMDNSEKLAGEARKLIGIWQNDDLRARFGQYFPRVYSAKLDLPPYAYVMQHFSCPPYTKLSDYVFRTSAEDLELVLHEVISILLNIHGSTLDRTLQPNLGTVYFDRIRERLGQAGRIDKRFELLRTQQVRLNGQLHKSPLQFIEQIGKHLNEIAPPFVTFVHGDPHPGNILFKRENSLEIKFIDVKEWPAGDYIWDCGKLIHYLLVTGPVEDMTGGVSGVELSIENGIPSISYDLKLPGHILAAVEKVISVIRGFAETWNDRSWKTRLNLSLAANLLGLPDARLRKRMEEAAIVMFAEGLRYLAEFASNVHVGKN